MVQRYSPTGPMRLAGDGVHAMTTPGSGHVDHRLLEYGSDEQFLAQVVPYILEGLEVGEPAVLVSSTRNLRLAKDTLSPEANELVRFADAESWGSGNVAARVLAIDWDIRKMLGTASRCRVVQEFTWQAAAQQREWLRHEAATNLLRPAAEVSLLCTVDQRTHPPEYLAELRRAHPVIAPDRRNDEYVEPRRFLAQADGTLDSITPIAAEISTAAQDSDLHVMRQRVTNAARAAGLGEYQIQCVALAATEVVANALHHAHKPATIRTWDDADQFACEVSDKGPGIDDPLASYRPPAPAGGRCGLWLARTFSDEVRIVSSPEGTIVRMTFEH
jgi:anti-sigma regulatory factor (Ser/Thr protein kinase)